MIAGVGLDLVDLVGFRSQLDDAASSFVPGTFTPGEIAASHERSTDRARHLGARYAAKEAFVKAWSSAAWGQAPALTAVDLREIEVVNDRWGRPMLRLGGAVAEAADAAGIGAMHVSLSHDGDTAGAVVVLERASAVR